MLDEIFKLKEELEDYRKTKEEISQVIGEIRRGRPKKSKNENQGGIKK